MKQFEFESVSCYDKVSCSIIRSGFSAALLLSRLGCPAMRWMLLIAVARSQYLQRLSSRLCARILNGASNIIDIHRHTTNKFIDDKANVCK